MLILFTLKLKELMKEPAQSAKELLFCRKWSENILNRLSVVEQLTFYGYSHHTILSNYEGDLRELPQRWRYCYSALGLPIDINKRSNERVKDRSILRS